VEEKRAVDWADIIPAALIEQHRPKQGADAYSDPEELFNPIAHRRVFLLFLYRINFLTKMMLIIPVKMCGKTRFCMDI
jgi:hypothetical protein